MSIVLATAWFIESVEEVGDWLFAVLMTTLFVIAELVPFLASLGTDVLRVFGPQRRTGVSQQQQQQQQQTRLGNGGWTQAKPRSGAAYAFAADDAGASTPDVDGGSSGGGAGDSFEPPQPSPRDQLLPPRHP